MKFRLRTTHSAKFPAVPIKEQAAQAECEIHLVSYCIILKKPVIIFIDTSSNQLLGGAVYLAQIDVENRFYNCVRE